jgi:probable blue pigment (indigoidine) exporter
VLRDFPILGSGLGTFGSIYPSYKSRDETITAWSVVLQWGVEAGVVGAIGVALLVLRGGASLDLIGVLAAFASVVVFATGFILVKVWQPPVGLLTFTAWQLVLGGLALVPVALLVEGRPPTLDLPALGGYAYIGIVGTVVAYAVWFRGARRLPAAAVSLIGLLNPVSGILIGLAFAGEKLTPVSALGMVLVLGGVLLGQPAVLDRIRARRTPEPGSRADVGVAG